jgi:hypothetical protein
MVTHEPDMAAYARRMVRFVDGVVASDEPQPAAGAPGGHCGPTASRHRRGGRACTRPDVA